MASSGYTPTRDDIVNVIKLLHENGISATSSRVAYEQLKQYEGNPSFCILLSCIFGSAECPVEELTLPVPWTQYRQLAGIVLKNNLTTARHSLGEGAVLEAARCALQALQRPKDVRVARAAAQVIVKVTTLTSFEWWTQCALGDLPTILLNDLLPSGGIETLAALYTLQYLMEDLPRQVGAASESIITKVSQLAVGDGALELRKAGFRMCFNVYEQSSLLDWNVDRLSPLQEGLVRASFAFSSTCTSLLEKACGGDEPFMILALRSCLLLLDYFEYFGQLDYDVKDRMCRVWVNGTLNLIATINVRSGGDQELAAAGIDFITGLLEENDRTGGEGAASFLVAPLATAITTLIQALVRYSFMSDEEVQSIIGSDDYRIRDATAVSFDVKEGTKDISEDNMLNEEAAAMTLRSSALKCIDAFCTYSSTTAFALLTQQVQHLWSNPDWKAREAGVVLVGTMAGGCSGELESLLPSLVLQLLQFTSNTSEHICVASSAIWTLSRLTECILVVAPSHFPGVISAVAGRLQSTSKRIQSASVSALNNAFSILESHGDLVLMERFFPEILQSIYACLPVYSTGNLSLLVDLTCRVLRCLKDGPELERLGVTLKQERMQRVRLFEESYTKVYVQPTPNALVDKDVFSLDRAVLMFLTVFPDDAFGLKSLEAWNGVLGDVLAREVKDDADLVFNTLLLCCGYVASTSTVSLQGSIDSTLWSLATRAYQSLVQLEAKSVESAALTLLSTLVRILGRAALPSGMLDSLTAHVAHRITEEDDTQRKGEFVCAIALLVSNHPTPLNDGALGALTAANAVLRSDVYGDSLFHFSQMAFALCQPMAAMPQLLPHFRIDVIAQLIAQAENSVGKSEATIRLFNTIGSAPPDAIVRFLSDAMRVAYSWQQGMENYPGTTEAISAALRCIVRSCPGAVEAQLEQLPIVFRNRIAALYGMT